MMMMMMMMMMMIMMMMMMVQFTSIFELFEIGSSSVIAFDCFLLPESLLLCVIETKDYVMPSL